MINYLLIIIPNKASIIKIYILLKNNYNWFKFVNSNINYIILTNKVKLLKFISTKNNINLFKFCNKIYTKGYISILGNSHW